jgi:hypothetical protein
MFPHSLRGLFRIRVIWSFVRVLLCVVIVTLHWLLVACDPTCARLLTLASRWVR